MSCPKVFVIGIITGASPEFFLEKTSKIGHGRPRGWVMYSCNSCQTSWSMDVDPPKYVQRAPGFWFPEWCFWFPWCFFSRNGVFSSRRVRWFPGCFQFPGWGVFSSQIRVCCSRNGVLGARGCFLFPEWCFRFPARGDGMAVFVVPVRCFFLFLLATLHFFVRCFLPFFPFFPHFYRFCLASCYSPNS